MDLLSVPGRGPAAPGSPSPSAVSVTSTGATKMVTFRPKQLYFPPPLDKVITNILHIQSTSPSCVVWTLSTVTPSRYRVSPTRGFLHPSGTTDVQISYKPRHATSGGKEDPSDLSDEKFQIEIRVAAPGDEADVDAVFRRPMERHERIRYKIRCVFAPEAKSPARSPGTYLRGTPVASLMGALSPGRSGVSDLRTLLQEKVILEEQLLRVTQEITREEAAPLAPIDVRKTPVALAFPLPLATALLIFAFFCGRVLSHMSHEILSCRT